MYGISIARRPGVFFRLILLVMLIVMLAPTLPAAADDPEAEAALEGDVSARVIAPQAKKVFPADGHDGDEFGWAVAIDGDLMLVGALDYSALEMASHEGAAYLYGRNVGGPNQWGLIKEFSNPTPAVGDNFGYSVAIQGTTLVIGAMHADAEEVGDEDGLAYVYERDAGGAGQWGQTAILSGTMAGIEVGLFGMSVALAGSTIVVGAAWTGPEGGDDPPGAAYIFGRNQGGPGAWGRVKVLTASDSAPRGTFGCSVALYGSTLAVGAFGATAGVTDMAGAVYLFERDAGGSGNWGETKKVVANRPISGSMFGSSVALAANTLVVGAYYATVDDIPTSGAAYIFERDAGGPGNWGQMKRLVHPDAMMMMYGSDVAVSDATVVVGHAVNYSRTRGGEAHVYSRNAGGTDQWGEIALLSDSASGDLDGMGWSVDIDGATVVVGALSAVGQDGKFSGAAYVYTPYALRVNSAGPKVVDTAGNVWVADRSWLAGTTPWGYVGGVGRVVSSLISGTEDDKLYQTERLYTGAAKPGYRFVVPNGRYRLTFKYAETYWNAAGKRKFTIMAEGKICSANYDPYVAAGGIKNKAAPDKVCYVDVTDGLLSIDFISVVGQAKADAIYIQQLYQ